MNCGRGCEIGLSRIDHLHMKMLNEPNVEYATLEQYVNRTKVQSKLCNFLILKLILDIKLILYPTYILLSLCLIINFFFQIFFIIFYKINF